MLYAHIELLPDGSPTLARPGAPVPTFCVYFIQSGDSNMVTIGMTIKPRQRLRTLQRGNPERLQYLGMLATSTPRRLEHYLHAHFAPYRRRGSDWFAFPAPLVAALHSGGRMWLRPRPFFLLPMSGVTHDRTAADIARAAAPNPIPSNTVMDARPSCHPSAAWDVGYAEGSYVLRCHSCGALHGAWRLIDVLPIAEDARVVPRT
jgi:hypothetical protein